jgi:hypothetical protein
LCYCNLYLILDWRTLFYIYEFAIWDGHYIHYRESSNIVKLVHLTSYPSYLLKKTVDSKGSDPFQLMEGPSSFASILMGFSDILIDAFKTEARDPWDKAKANADEITEQERKNKTKMEDKIKKEKKEAYVKAESEAREKVKQWVYKRLKSKMLQLLSAAEKGVYKLFLPESKLRLFLR